VNLEAIQNMKKFKSRLIVSMGSESFALQTKEIACIYRDKYIIIVVDKSERRFLYDKSLSELESELDPRYFFRANRKFIINIEYIKSYRSIDKVKLDVRLTLPSNPYQIIVSQENAPLFKKWLQEEF